MKEPRILVLDIETSPLVAYVWGTHEQEVGLNQIKDDWFLLAWGAKWLGDPPSKMMYMDQRGARRIGEDKPLLKPLWKLLDEADIVITHNGKNFDSPKLNARFILNEMNPPSSYVHLDTYQIVRRVAKFTSNKLHYLTDKLCKKYKKLSHARFPGMALWTECLAGNKAAWDEMKTYNINDVLSTEELYLKIRAWAATKAHQADDPSQKCGTCGEEGKIYKSGTRIYRQGTVQRYRCRDCGGCQQGSLIR